MHCFNNEYYESLGEEELVLFRNIAENTLDITILTEDQKEILSYAIQQNYLIKDGDELYLNFLLFYKEQLDAVKNILQGFYPEGKGIFNKLYEEVASVIKKGMPEFLDREADNYISALIFNITPLTLAYALEKQIISRPEGEASYLTFFLWCKK